MAANRADAKQRLAELWDRAHPAAAELVEVEVITDPPPTLQPGITLWRVNGSMVAMPSLDPAAPFEMQRRYLTRCVATATGYCPACSAVAGVNADPQRTPAAWAMLSVGVSLVHLPSCPCTFGPDEAHWFPLFRPPTTPLEQR